MYSESDRKTSSIIDKTSPKEGDLSPPPTPVTIMIVHILNHIGVRRGGGEGVVLLKNDKNLPKYSFSFLVPRRAMEYKQKRNNEYGITVDCISTILLKFIISKINHL